MFIQQSDDDVDINLLDNFSSGECDNPASAGGRVFHQGTRAWLVRMILMRMRIVVRMIMMIMTSQGMAGDQDDEVNQNLWAKIATITITVNITPTDIYNYMD